MTLTEWIQKSGGFGQQLIKEWTGMCIDGSILDINNVASMSNKKMIWKCDRYEGYTWEATVNNRVNHLQKCPYCSGKKCVTGVNDLYTWCLNNGDIGNKIITEWVGIDEKGNSIDMHSTMSKSNKVVKWQCMENNNHTWYAPISRRTSNYSGCTQCKYEKERLVKIRKASKKGESIAEWCDKNGYWGSIIRQEWTGVSKKGDKFSIDELASKSGQNLMWKCSKGHTFYQRVYDRVVNKHGCIQCSKAGTSRNELFIYYTLKQVFPRTIHRGRFQGYEFDITIPEIKMCIEYGSLVWHDDKRERDMKKLQLCSEYNIRFLEIIDTTLYDEDDFTNTTQTIYFKANYRKLPDKTLISIIDFILKQYNHSIDEVNIDKALEDAMNHKYDKN